MLKAFRPHGWDYMTHYERERVRRQRVNLVVIVLLGFFICVGCGAYALLVQLTLIGK